jgi:predicted RNase H-like HicB family nuclease
MKRQVTLMCELPYRLMREGAWIVSLCPALDIASQGKTPRSALRHLREAVALVLKDGLASGALESVLEQTGFVRMELAGRVVWVADPEQDKGRGLKSMAIRVRAAAPALRPAKARRVRLLTVLPWTISTALHAQARAS